MDGPMFFVRSGAFGLAAWDTLAYVVDRKPGKWYVWSQRYFENIFVASASVGIQTLAHLFAVARREYVFGGRCGRV